MTLEQSLRELAQDDAAMRVPAHVDANVMAAWDAAAGEIRHQATPHRRVWWAWAVTAAAVVAVLAIAGSVLMRAGPVAPAAGSPARSVDAGSASAFASATPDRSRKPAYGGQKYVGRIPRSGPAEAQEYGGPVSRPVRRSFGEGGSGPAVPIVPPPIDAGYVLVPGAASDSLTLMRVRMPRSAFSTLGLPIANPDGDGLVDVDVLVGEDGVARSIRRAAAVGWPGANSN